MTKKIYFIISLISSIYLLERIGIFTPKKIFIDNLSISTPNFYNIELAMLEFEKLDLSCYIDLKCVESIKLSDINKSVPSASLIFKNIFNDTLLVSVSKYIKDSKKVMREVFGKTDLIINECRIKKIKSNSSLCVNCMEYQILKDKYHIDIVSNKKSLLDKKLNEICK